MDKKSSIKENVGLYKKAISSDYLSFISVFKKRPKEQTLSNFIDWVQKHGGKSL